MSKKKRVLTVWSSCALGFLWTLLLPVFGFVEYGNIASAEGVLAIAGAAVALGATGTALSLFTTGKATL